MTADDNNHISKTPEDLINDLQALLKKQIEFTNKGDIGGVESLSIQVSSLIEECMHNNILNNPAFKNQREELYKLYGQLSLALSAQRAGTGEQINRIRKGKKTIAAYRSSI